MIARIAALVQRARTAPPGPLTAVIGATAAGAGLALISRYQQHLLAQVAAGVDELHTIDRLIGERQARVEAQRAELAELRRQRREAEAGVDDHAQEQTQP